MRVWCLTVVMGFSVVFTFVRNGRDLPKLRPLWRKRNLKNSFIKRKLEKAKNLFWKTSIFETFFQSVCNCFLLLSALGKKKKIWRGKTRISLVYKQQLRLPLAFLTLHKSRSSITTLLYGPLSSSKIYWRPKERKEKSCSILIKEEGPKNFCLRRGTRRSTTGIDSGQIHSVNEIGKKMQKSKSAPCL